MSNGIMVESRQEAFCCWKKSCVTLDMMGTTAAVCLFSLQAYLEKMEYEGLMSSARLSFHHGTESHVPHNLRKCRSF